MFLLSRPVAITQSGNATSIFRFLLFVVPLQRTYNAWHLKLNRFGNTFDVDGGENLPEPTLGKVTGSVRQCKVKGKVPTIPTLLRHAEERVRYQGSQAEGHVEG